MTVPILYAPWCWYIYLHDWDIFTVNVSKYSSTIEHLGMEHDTFIDEVPNMVMFQFAILNYQKV